MKIPEFLEDLNIISKLGDNPGADNGLTAEGLKAKFDEAGLKLQNYLNNILLVRLNEFLASEGILQEGFNMIGPIRMNQNKLSGLPDPTEAGDAVSLGYANRSYRASSWTPSAAEVGATPASHAEDKDNPHGVTAAQVGAAPSGYGLGGNAALATNSDLNNAVYNGWYGGNVNSPDGAWWSVHVTRNTNGAHIHQTAYKTDGSVAQREKAGGEWSDWIDVSPSNFAPAGYGYDGNKSPRVLNITDDADGSMFNNVIDNIVAEMPRRTVQQILFVDAPCLGGTEFFGSLYCHSVNYCVVTGWSYSGQIITKVKYGGVWRDWTYTRPTGASIKEVLWENANISNAFNAQTISLDLSGYDGVEILYYVDSTTNVYQNTGFIKKGQPGVMYYVTADAGNRLHRTFTVNTNSIVFNTATASSSADVSTLCKPYRIYGIKGLL